MNYVNELIHENNFCALGLVVLILLALGQAMLQGKPNLQVWGLRTAAVVFLVFAVMRGIERRASSADDLLSALMVGLLAGAVLLGPTWIVLAILGFGYENFRKLIGAARARTQTRREQREQQHQQQAEAPAPQQQTPEQQRAEREAAELRRQEAESAAEATKRREDAIAACELLYHLRAPDIGERFPREQLDEFVSKYMGGDKAIEVVERRAGELQQLIQQHYEAVCPPSRFADLAELTAWYEQQKEQIGSLAVADIYKQDFIVQLNARYAELTEQTLEKL